MIRGTTQIAANAATLIALMQQLHSAFHRKLPGRISDCGSVRLSHLQPFSWTGGPRHTVPGKRRL